MNILYILGTAVAGIILGYNLRPDKTRETHRLIYQLIYKTNQIMATLAEFKAAFAEINEATTNIAADIERLAGQIGGGGLSDAEETEALNELKSVAEQLKSIAATTPDGTPTPAPEG